ncbi:MAG: ABC transporter substrate-binding protein [Acidimicrobiales bacterium]
MAQGTRALKRSWGRFQRRPVGVRLGTVAVIIVVIGGIAYGLSSNTGNDAGSSTVTTPSARPTALENASTSTVGITSKTITIGFPVSNLNALASNLGFETDVEYSEQAKAIDLFVDQINNEGGIYGRKIIPDIVNIDPTNETDMRAVCKSWTEGPGAVFAVLDGVGSWDGDDQLCITQEGHTPLISEWTTVPNFAQPGEPYLWWTGPNQAQVLIATVDWAKSEGYISNTNALGIIAGDRPSDQDALNDYLLPALKKMGIPTVVEPIAANPDEAAATQADAPLVLEKLKAAGVKTMLPLIPFNVFFPIISQENSQEYFPRLLLSDYEFSIETSLGILQIFAKALNGQEGVTTETLGGIDDDRPYSQGGYDPGVRQCWDVWHKAYPQTPKGNINDHIEEQGPVQGWCQQIRLLDDALKIAGPHLDRRTFVEAMSKITNFPGGYSPVFSFGPNKIAGPSQYRVVKLHINTPPSAQCKRGFGKNAPPAGVCWVVEQNWTPLPSVPNAGYS